MLFILHHLLSILEVDLHSLGMKFLVQIQFLSLQYILQSLSAYPAAIQNIFPLPEIEIRIFI